MEDTTKKVENIDNYRLMRELIYIDRQIKTLASERKQIEQELNKRYDEGRLNENEHI